jgi:peptidoglycan-associated lipoprotein
MKSLQSDGDAVGGKAQPRGTAQEGSQNATGSNAEKESTGSEWNGQGVNPNFPGMVSGGSGNELRGLSQDPSEERLMPGSVIASAPVANANGLQRTELTNEEKAAVEAGLKDVFFGYNQWTLSQNGMEALNHNAKWLKEHPGALLKVEGHCDERGTAEYNMVLGEKRSKSARSYLVELGVNPKQIGIVSYGKERPFCTDHHETCYQQNRRGHMLLKLRN